MKKQLLALAVGAATMTPGQLLAEGPTLYGKLNVAVERQTEMTDPRTATRPARTGAWEVESYKSRLGVKGSYDLDVGGLKAIYKAEYEIFADDGVDSSGNAFKQRDIFAGLQGKFGTVKLGKFNSPLKKAEGPVDQFNDYDTDMGSAMVGQDRFDNIIQYSSPAFADAVTLNLALIPNENQDDFNQPANGKNENSLDDTVSASLVFRQGGVFASLATNQDQLESLELDEGSTDVAPTINITRAVVGFEGDTFEVGALYQQARENKQDRVNIDPETGVAYFDGRGESSYVLSGAVSIDRFTLKAQHQVTEADLNKDELTVSTLGADYALAKGSKVYLYYGMSELDFDALGVPDEEGSVASLGMEHKF